MAQTNKNELIIGKGAARARRAVSLIGEGFMFLMASSSAIAVIFIFIFIIRDAIPFFRLEGFKEFFTSARWYPSAEHPEFGALAIFVGSALVTTVSVLMAAPLGFAAAICLSDVLPFSARQVVKPIVEVIAAIPSVAYGFFALVVLAPLLQERGGMLLATSLWVVGLPPSVVLALVVADLVSSHAPEKRRKIYRWTLAAELTAASTILIFFGSTRLVNIELLSGTNALNVSIILAIMVLPTIVSVAEDALSAVGRDLREGSYALGATRAETIIRVVMPAAASGMLAALLLGVMRAIGETMVVWMASGNAAQIPSPFYNVLQPVRTLTATIAGDMGEADHVTGSSRFHVLFAMGLCLLLFSFVCNLASEAVARRIQRKREA